MIRLIVNVVLVLSIFIVPWWIVMLGAAIALFIFPSYFEILFLGIIIDSLYNAPIRMYFHIEFIVTITAIILFIIAEVLKRRLRFYN